MRQTTIDQKISALQNTLEVIAESTGVSLEDTLAGMGFDKEQTGFILAKESTSLTINKELAKYAPEPENIPGFEVILNVKANYEELKSLDNLPYLSISDKGNRIIELCTYNELEAENKNQLVDKYLDAAGLIGADSIEFYGIC